MQSARGTRHPRGPDRWKTPRADRRWSTLAASCALRLAERRHQHEFTASAPTVPRAESCWPCVARLPPQHGQFAAECDDFPPLRPGGALGATHASSASSIAVPGNPCCSLDPQAATRTGRPTAFKLLPPIGGDYACMNRAPSAKAHPSIGKALVLCCGRERSCMAKRGDDDNRGSPSEGLARAHY